MIAFMHVFICVQLEQTTQQLKSLESMGGEEKREEPKKATQKVLKQAEWPADHRVNPYLRHTFDPVPAPSFSLQKTFKGHSMAVSGLALHPRKPILATVSDDMSWKMWSIPSGDLIMSGDGHKAWVAGCDFHPKGTSLATCSGDGTVKVWDFVNAVCAATFTDHTQVRALVESLCACIHSRLLRDSGSCVVSCLCSHKYHGGTETVCFKIQNLVTFFLPFPRTLPLFFSLCFFALLFYVY